jgi:hypothetical protein
MCKVPIENNVIVTGEDSLYSSVCGRLRKVIILPAGEIMRDQVMFEREAWRCLSG